MTPTCSFPAALADCRDTEDYFRLLGVEYDERALATGRLHVLELFRRELAVLGPVPVQIGEDVVDTDPALLRCRGALERAYTAFLDGGALRHRVFKVLRDRAPVQFLPDADLVAALEPDGGDLR